MAHFDPLRPPISLKYVHTAFLYYPRVNLGGSRAQMWLKWPKVTIWALKSQLGTQKCPFLAKMTLFDPLRPQYS